MLTEQIKVNFQQDPVSFLKAEMARFILEAPENRMPGTETDLIFETPIVGVADGDDPLFQQYKTVVGSFHLTPREVLSKSKPGVRPVKVSVVCWILPVSEATRISNRRQKAHPSKRWAYTRHYGEKFNDAVRRHLVQVLTSQGYTAVAPVLEPYFKMDEVLSGWPSNWSERHACYAAGLGTFSLSDGFITPKGIAMRCGSVVTDAAIALTPRPYSKHTENCLFYRDGSCIKCIKRCPVGAITRAGHDKEKCRIYLLDTLSWLKQDYGVTGYTGCGLCQTAVPCEARIPPKAK